VYLVQLNGTSGRCGGPGSAGAVGSRLGPGRAHRPRRLRLSL